MRARMHLITNRAIGFREAEPNEPSPPELRKLRAVLAVEIRWKPPHGHAWGYVELDREAPGPQAIDAHCPCCTLRCGMALVALARDRGMEAGDVRHDVPRP